MELTKKPITFDSSITRTGDSELNIKTMELITTITAKEISYNVFEIGNQAISEIIASCKVLDMVALDQEDLLSAEGDYDELLKSFCRKYGFWVEQNGTNIEYHSHSMMVSRPIISPTIGEMTFSLFTKDPDKHLS